MNDLQSEMNRVVAGFVAEITELARRAAMDSLQSAFGKRGGTAIAALRNGRGRGRGAKRTAGELDKLGERFLEFVGKHPGLRIEQINRQLGTTTRDLALPIRKLIAEGALKTKGEKRSTAYFAGERKKKS